MLRLPQTPQLFCHRPPYEEVVVDPDADLEVIDRWDGGFSWFANPDERLQRTSHALVDGDGVWLVDPVDAAGLDGLLEPYGEVSGVLVLLDRHRRDAAAVATRHGTAVTAPAWVADALGSLETPIEPVVGSVGGTAFEVVRVIDRRLWHEGALTDGSTLVVAEAIGTAPHYVVGSERLGVHPLLRLRPPRGPFRELAPDRVLVGHGRGVGDDAAKALESAFDGARRRAPALYLKALGSLLGR